MAPIQPLSLQLPVRRSLDGRDGHGQKVLHQDTLHLLDRLEPAIRLATALERFAKAHEEVVLLIPRQDRGVFGLHTHHE